MTRTVQNVLEAFGRLTPDEQRQAVVEILRRAVGEESPPLDDDTLARIADESFQEYDAREAADAQG